MLQIWIHDAHSRVKYKKYDMVVIIKISALNLVAGPEGTSNHHNSKSAWQFKQFVQNYTL